jgi:hypothetical protein
MPRLLDGQDISPSDDLLFGYNFTPEWLISCIDETFRGLNKEKTAVPGQAINVCKEKVEEIFKNELIEIKNC